MKEHVMGPRYGGFGDEAPDEQQYHQERFARIAEERNRSASVRAGLKGRMTAEDVMREEADRDNEQFEKRLSQEHREWDRRLQEVVQDFRAVRDNAPGKPEQFRAVQLLLGTGLASGSCTGQLMALDDMGYGTLPDVVIGSSGASGPAVFQVAGQSRVAASLFMNECTTEEFLKKSPVPKLDTGVIAREMRSGPKALDQEAVRRSKREVYAIVSNARTRKAEFIDFKTAKPDMITACEASSAIPFFREPVEIEGNQYYDGAFSQVPLEEIIERFKPTHLLIHPNVAFNYLANFHYDALEKAIVWTTVRMGSVGSMGAVEEYFRKKERVRELFDQIGKLHGVKIGVLWPPEEGLGNLTNDPDIMKTAILESYRKTVSDFGEQQPQRVRLFPGDDEARPVQKAA